MRPGDTEKATLDNLSGAAVDSQSARVEQAARENAQLRKLVVQLLLEKAQLEEKLVKPRPSGR